MAPIAAPAARAIIIITGIGIAIPGRLNSFATTTHAIPNIEPTDMSKLPEIITGDKPTAMIPRIENVASIPLKFPRLANLGFISPKTSIIIPYTIISDGVIEFLLKTLIADKNFCFSNFAIYTSYYQETLKIKNYFARLFLARTS
jgi:hypothetical protein